MESDIHFLQIRNPHPPSLPRGRPSPFNPVPSTCTILHNDNRIFSTPLSLSISLCSSSSSSAFSVSDPKSPSICENDIFFHGTQNHAIQPHNGFKRIIPGRREYTHNTTGSPNKSNNGVEKSNFDIDRTDRLKQFSEMLRDCALNRSLNEGKGIHGHIIKCGIDLDSHLWVSLINFYAKCRCLKFAQNVFAEMPERDVVSCTVLLAGYVGDGCSSEGLSVFCEMQREGIMPNQFTLATALKACSMCLDKELGKQIHTQVVKVGVLEDLYVGSALVDFYAKCREMEYADKVFILMPEQNAVSWNALLNGYAQAGNGEQLLRLFCRMKETKIKFNKFTLSTLLKGCANSGDLVAGKLVHSMGIKIGCEDDEVLSCSLVDMYSKCGIADDALKVFSRIKNPDIVTWSAIICCLDQQGRSEEATELFCLMMHTSLSPNQFTLASAVNAATSLGDINYCKSIHASIYKYCYKFETLVNNALITMYMKMRLIEDGYKVFRLMSRRDVVSYNALLSGYQDNKKSFQGPGFFNLMLLEGLNPNMYTFVSILRSCSSLLNLQYGKQIHAHVVKKGVDIDGYIGTALIDMYAKCRCFQDVEVIFHRLTKRDVFTWTVMIATYAQTNQGEKAICYFNNMRKDGINPNEFTLASTIRGCSTISSFVNGRQLHSLAMKTGHDYDMFVVSAIVDMYAKCGFIDDAEIIFNCVDTLDIVLWNTMICNYAQHGKGKKALSEFENMLNDGLSPDGFTFLGILSACSHMGLVKEGRHYFDSMSEVYNITPSIEHFACMVDILGRAGKFNEMESFIEEMELSQHALIWKTVLGSCKVHGNEELAEKAAEKLFVLEPEIDSNYILLSNLFASKGKWCDVSRIRALMTNRGVKKEPGCSWVEVDSRVHTFLSQDSSHPMIKDIYQKLDELGNEVTKLGYIPQTEYVLKNVTEQEKKENLKCHSERLALAFSLIKDVPNKTIRIFKNLRICGDCHEYMKLVSKITKQEIVVRDIHRFHHFQYGKCSCRDYW